jgi:mannose-6-phosphate isomerase
MFRPIYKERIWGGGNLQRLFRRALPPGQKIGESWDLADLAEGVSTVINGPLAGRTLNDLTGQMGSDLLGGAKPMPDGRFPLLLKLLDANDILSVQVHPDERAVRELGGGALKTECWYILESREGFIYKGVRPDVTAQQFRRAVEVDRVADLLQRYDVKAGDFHYLPAGAVHALGPGVVVAEVQTPSDTTYRVSDWGRGRQIHIEQSMRCIRFDISCEPPGHTDVNTLLQTPYFNVEQHTAGINEPKPLPHGRCAAVMITSAAAKVEVRHDGAETAVAVAGDTVLLPAGLKRPLLVSSLRCDYLLVTLPQ